ncbi:MAG: hypothetical protein KF814_18000 [Nitrospiraceae bacterium]|nr:hypothetical protein [Nitrospiraceae bacterium]
MRHLSDSFGARGRWMRCVILTPVIWCAASVATGAETDHSRERVALMLTGAGCPVQRARMAAVLSEFPSVRHVEFDTVPDHVLVDVESGSVAPESLRQAVLRSLGETKGCQVEVMTSCITASPAFLTR